MLPCSFLLSSYNSLPPFLSTGDSERLPLVEAQWTFPCPFPCTAFPFCPLLQHLSPSNTSLRTLPSSSYCPATPASQYFTTPSLPPQLKHQPPRINNQQPKTKRKTKTDKKNKHNQLSKLRLLTRAYQTEYASSSSDINGPLVGWLGTGLGYQMCYVRSGNESFCI